MRPTFSKRTTTFTWSYRGTPIYPGKHQNWATDGTYVYSHAGDGDGGSYNQQMVRATLSDVLNGSAITFTQQQAFFDDIVGPRPIQPDDGGWFYDATLGKFLWFPGGGQLIQGVIYTYASANPYLATPTAPLTRAANGTYNGTRWTAYVPMTWSAASGWASVDFSSWTTVSPDPGAPTIANEISGDNCRAHFYDSVRRRVYSIIRSGVNWLAVHDFANQRKEIYRFERSAAGITLPTGTTGPVEYQRNYIHWLHQGAWVDTTTGYMYLVSPYNGQLLRVRPNDALTTNGTERHVAFDVMPNQLQPHMGRIVASDSGADNHKLVGYQGGLLYWYGNPQSLDGWPWGMWWRSLSSDDQQWTPVEYPREFRGNSVCHLGSQRYMCIGGDMDSGEPTNRYFWVIT